ncbi:hypothetical protein LJC15_04175 [Desulfovibrio sp. OttesenSCG-928-G11]|nr:hypothetical protein [Desulfovibrio sp. OttesenSCG-928-G11]
MQGQQIPVITTDYLANLHTMLEQLTIGVDQIKTKLENITVPAQPQITPAPVQFEVSLSFLAAATGTSKSTVERRIANGKLPKPQVNADNGYRYWIKSALPKSLHAQIDAHYDATRASK